MSAKVTLADVAAAAGVSKMTASRALRGAKDVSQANIARVRQAAQDIGYLGNHMAASLSASQSDLVGVVVPSLSNIVFAEVMAGIEQGLAGTNLQPLFGVTDYDPAREQAIIRNMLSWRPAGLIVTGLDQMPETRTLLANATAPVVQILDTDGDAVDLCVGFSQHDAGAEMGRALIAAGRRRFGYVGCALGRDTRAAKRYAGFRDAVGDALVATELSDLPSSVAEGRRMTADLLQTGVDAIYFSNDDVAAGGLFHCIAAGITVPDQVMLAGFNGIDLLDSLPFPIATTRTPRRDIGITAAKAIITAPATKTPMILQPDIFLP